MQGNNDGVFTSVFTSIDNANNGSRSCNWTTMIGIRRV